MTTITGARVYVVELPLIRTFSTSNKTTSSSRLVIVRLQSSDGPEGWGEAPLNPTFTSESSASAREALGSVIDHHLVGRSALDVVGGGREGVLAPLDQAIAARCALSMALWDLRGRLLGVPLYELLGGARRTAVPTVWHIGNFDDAEDAREAKEAASQGFSTIKLKVGRPDVGHDLDAVARVREEIPTDVRIHVDANQAWSRPQAAAFAQHARELGVAVIEQPLARWDVAGLAELSRTSGVVVAADESVFEAEDLLAAVTSHAVPAGVVVKLLKAGGIDGARALLGLCGLARVQPFVAGMPGDSSIGSAALLHVAAAAEGLPLGTAITPHFSGRDLVAEPLPVVAGHVHLSAVEGPGLGIEVDVEAVEASSL